MTPAAAHAGPSPVFHLDGEQLVPTRLAQGPWYPDTQHGSAMLGLLARAVELHPSREPMQVTRLTVDFMRAAPLSAVTTPTRSVRAGRNADLVDATIEANGQVFARAFAMRFRLRPLSTESEKPRYGTGLPFPLPPDEEAIHPLLTEAPMEEAFHVTMDMRAHVGGEAPAIWFRMAHPLVAGEVLSPLVRVAITADWTYSIPFINAVYTDPDYLEKRDFNTINPDTSINLHRPMKGEWLCLDSHVHYGEVGAGTALALLLDEVGPIGHSSQSILIREGEAPTTASSA